MRNAQTLRSEEARVESLREHSTRREHARHSQNYGSRYIGECSGTRKDEKVLLQVALFMSMQQVAPRTSDKRKRFSHD